MTLVNAEMGLCVVMALFCSSFCAVSSSPQDNIDCHPIQCRSYTCQFDFSFPEALNVYQRFMGSLSHRSKFRMAAVGGRVVVSSGQLRARL